MAAYHTKSSVHNNKKKISISYIIRDKDETSHRSGINSLQYDPVRERLYSAGRDSVIRIWGLESDASNHQQDLYHSNHRFPSASSNGGDNHAIFTAPQEVGYLQSMEHHTDWVNDITLCCNGRNLISVSNDTTIKVWNAQQGFCLSTLRSHKDYSKCLAYAKDREIVASAGFDRMIYLWDIHALTILTASKNTVTTKPLDGSKSSIYSLAINRNGTLVASGSTEKVIRLWDPRSRQKLLKLRGHTNNVRSLQFSNDGSFLLSAGSDGTIRLWSIAQQRCVSVIRVHDEGVWTLQTDESFSTVYSGGRDGRIFKTDLRDTSSSILICEEPAPVLKILLVDRIYSDNCLVPAPVNGSGSLWVATTDSALKNWSIDCDVEFQRAHRSSPSKTRANSTDIHNLVELKLNDSPSVHIDGNPAVINYHILNDKRHILTRESDNSVGLYDVLTAQKLETLAKCDGPTASRARYEEEIKKRFRMVYVPNWFSVDLKIGLLCIHLDESECFAAWVSARDYGFVLQDDAQDPKVNLGCLMLQALLEHWPPTYEGCDNGFRHPNDSILGASSYENSKNMYFSRSNSLLLRHNKHDPERGHLSDLSQRVGNQYFSIPGHTPIIISEGSQTLLRFLAQDACKENEDLFLQEIVPSWITESVISKCQPKFTKIPFFLLPLAESGKSLRKERLSASDMLQMRKVIEHVCEKMMASVNNEPGVSNGDHTANTISKSAAMRSGTPENDPKPYPSEKIKLYCHEQELEETLDLRTVKHYIWKSGGDLVLYYVPKNETY